MTLGDHRRAVVSRGIEAIDNELRLLVTVRRIMEEFGKDGSELWFDLLLDERSRRLDQSMGERSRSQGLHTEGIVEH